jgi:hypothetical protein
LTELQWREGSFKLCIAAAEGGSFFYVNRTAAEGGNFYICTEQQQSEGRSTRVERIAEKGGQSSSGESSTVGQEAAKGGELHD